MLNLNIYFQTIDILTLHFKHLTIMHHTIAVLLITEHTTMIHITMIYIVIKMKLLRHQKQSAITAVVGLRLNSMMKILKKSQSLNSIPSLKLNKAMSHGLT